MYSINWRRGSDIHAAADQCLTRLGASPDFRGLDCEILLREVTERLRNAHRKKGDRILEDREPNGPESGRLRCAATRHESGDQHGGNELPQRCQGRESHSGVPYGSHGDGLYSTALL